MAQRTIDLDVVREEKMALSPNIENSLRDAVNAGLGAFKAAQEKLNDIQSQLSKGYSDLVSKGAADQSAEVSQLRGLLEQGLGSLKEAQTRLETLLKK
ncbi:MAG: hypothetical protein K1X75_04830 [Leptospirales bacterium]|nr:hypothetical protein [Leptospirales bacterium]